MTPRPMRNDGGAYKVGDGGDGGDKCYARKAGGEKSYPREVGDDGGGGGSKSFAREVCDGDGDRYSCEIGEGGGVGNRSWYTSGVADGAGRAANHVTPRPRKKRASRKIRETLRETDSSSAKESDDTFN